MKKMICLIMFLSMMLAGCSTNEKDVAQVVENYFDAIISGELEKGDEYLEDRLNYMDVTFMNGMDSFLKYLSLVTADIDSIEVLDELAIANVILIHPETETLLNAQMSAIGLGSTDSDHEKAVLKVLNKEECPMETDTVSVVLKKEESGWKIITNKGFTNAIAFGKNELLTMEKYLENSKNEEDMLNYIKENVELIDYVVEYSSERDAPIIKDVVVKNAGGKDIRTLSVGIDFLNGSQQIIERKSIDIIQPMDMGIKAGYSWKMEKQDEVAVHNIVNEIDVSKVEVYINSVEFGEIREDVTTESAESVYIRDNVKLIGYKVGMFESYQGTNLGISEVSVKNEGDRNISSLTVTVFFQDKEGKNVAEDSFMVIGSLFGGDTLKANYSWKMTDNEFYEIENLADDVDTTRNVVKITEIVFE